MLRETLFLFSLIVFQTLGLTCNEGNTGDLISVKAVNCDSTGDSCVTAQLSTLELYFCGNCVSANTSTILKGVKCCGSNLCNTIDNTTVIDGSTCESITNKTVCMSRSDCLYSSGGVAGNMCLSIEYFDTPCWSIKDLYFPNNNSVSPNIDCPPVSPKFNVTNKAVFDYKMMIDYGYYPVTNVTFVALGLMNLKEVRYLNDTTAYCVVNNELKNWCGSNNAAQYSYCIMSEQWPQPDIIGWLENSTYLDVSSTWPGRPAICVCKNTSRAYYIPENPKIYPKYSLSCPSENAILFFFIMMMILNLVLMLWVLFDLVLLVAWTVKNKVDVFTASFKVKVVVIIYNLLSIALNACYVALYNRSSFFELIVWMRFGCIILIIFVYDLSIFTFTELIIEIQLLGERMRKTMIGVKWGVFLFITILLIAGIVLVGVDDHYIRWIDRTYKISDLIDLYVPYNGINRAIFIILIAVQAFSGIQSGILLSIVTYIFYSNSDSIFGQKQMKNIFVRNISLIVALIFLFVNLAIFCYSTYFFGWARILDTDYDRGIAGFWIFFASNFTEFLWIWAVAYSMRTSFNKTWFYQQLRKTFNSPSGTHSSKSNKTHNTNDTS